MVTELTPPRTSTYERPFTCEGNYVIRSFRCNTKRPSVKQSIKQQVSSNLAHKPSLADGPPYY